MRGIDPVIKHFAVVALTFGMALLAGCSYTVMPKSIQPIRGGENASLKGVSLIVMSAEKDTSDYAIPTDTGDRSALRANRQAWSTMLVENLAGELAKRGARVSSKARLTMNISLPEITFSRNNELYRFSVKVLVASSTGWQKNYVGTAESGRGSFESISSMVNRLAGQALAEDVKVMLNDAEFIKQARGK